jgi:hypothetical protein
MTPPPVWARRGDIALRKRFDENASGDAPSERDASAVDLHEQRAVERASRIESDGVTGVDAIVVQTLAQSVPAFKVDDACFFSRAELIESHRSRMIMILIRETREEAISISPRVGCPACELRLVSTGGRPTVARILPIP